jgi:hypothetical protein
VDDQLATTYRVRSDERVAGSTRRYVIYRMVAVWLPGTIAISAIAVFCWLATWQIMLPGLYYDELIQIVPALDIVRGPLTSYVGGIPESRVQLFGRTIALMTMDYMGAVKQFAFLPVAALAGVTPESIRIFSIGIGALSLLATFAFVRRLYGSLMAVLTVVLLATDPSMIFYARVDYGPTVFMLLFKAVALWQCARWWQTGSLVSLLLGSLALGLGVYDKTNFLWAAGAIVLSTALISFRGLARRLSARMVLVAAGGFAVGSLPLIWFNLTWPPRTLQALLGPAMQDPVGGSPLTQIWHRLGLLLALLDGRQVEQWLGEGQPLRPVTPIMLGIAVVIILTLAAAPATRARVGPAMFALLCGLLILLAAAMTRGGFAPHHVIIAYPFPHVVIAAAMGHLVPMLLAGQGTVRRALAVTALALGVLLPTGSSIIAYSTIMQHLEFHGGRRNWSDAIYRLHEVVGRARPPAVAVVLDWGIHFNLVALSQGRLTSLELWPLLNDPTAPPDPVVRLFAEPNHRYILHAPEATNFRRARDRFFDLVRQSRVNARLEAVIISRDGKPVFEVYSIVPGV